MRFFQKLFVPLVLILAFYATAQAQQKPCHCIENETNYILQVDCNSGNTADCCAKKNAVPLNPSGTNGNGIGCFKKTGEPRTPPIITKIMTKHAQLTVLAVAASPSHIMHYSLDGKVWQGQNVFMASDGDTHKLKTLDFYVRYGDGLCPMHYEYVLPE